MGTITNVLKSILRRKLEQRLLSPRRICRSVDLLRQNEYKGGLASQCQHIKHVCYCLYCNLIVQKCWNTFLEYKMLHVIPAMSLYSIDFCSVSDMPEVVMLTPGQSRVRSWVTKKSMIFDIWTYTVCHWSDWTTAMPPKHFTDLIQV